MKYLVRRTNTKTGQVSYKLAKCLDTWSSSTEYCWRYSKQGAKAIADRYNKSSTLKRYGFVYDIVPAEVTQ